MRPSRNRLRASRACWAFSRDRVAVDVTDQQVDARALRIFPGELSGAYSGACTGKVPDSDFASIASHSISVRPGRPAPAKTIPVDVPCFHAIGLPSRWHQGKLMPSLGADSPGHVSVHYPVLAPKRTPVWISARIKRRWHLEVSEVGAGMTMPDRTPRNGSPVPASGIVRHAPSC